MRLSKPPFFYLWLHGEGVKYWNKSYLQDLGTQSARPPMFLLQISIRITPLASTRTLFLCTSVPPQHLREASHTLEIKPGWNTSRWYMRFVLTLKCPNKKVSSTESQWRSFLQMQLNCKHIPCLSLDT